MAIKIVKAEEAPTLTQFQQRALERLDDARAVILAGRSRFIAITVNQDPPEGPGADPEAANETFYAYATRKGVVVPEITGVLFEAMTRLSMSGYEVDAD